jgi:hypothetical protein
MISYDLELTFLCCSALAKLLLRPHVIAPIVIIHTPATVDAPNLFLAACSSLSVWPLRVCSGVQYSPVPFASLDQFTREISVFPFVFLWLRHGRSERVPLFSLTRTGDAIILVSVYIISSLIGWMTSILLFSCRDSMYRSDTT